MRAGLDDLSGLQDDDFVRASNRAQPMRDDKRGAASHQPFQRFEQRAFCFRVERAGRLIENQNGRILEQCTSDGDALAFAA